MIQNRLLAALFVAALAAAAGLLFAAGRGGAQAGWAIRSFDVTYTINADGAVDVVEDLRVDFGSLQRHGIYRDLPVEYEYDNRYNRLVRVTDVAVDDGAAPHRFQLEGGRPNLRIRIGDPDVLVSGEQRYRIRYRLLNALNPQATHDEFYWNVTGDEWEAPIESASATVILPAPAVTRVACYEGPRGSRSPCGEARAEGERAFFAAGRTLFPGENFTVVVGLQKGAVAVGPPELVEKESFVNYVRDFLGLEPLPIGIALAVFAGGLAVLGRQWWVAGRDRWYGDNYLTAPAAGDDGTGPKPLFAHETVVVEYTPPEVDGGHRLRPAEVGLLIDERADTLDVSATIVDLAVRGYLRIKETKEGGILGLFEERDYELERLKEGGPELRDYEQDLLSALFATGPVVKLSDLKTKFYDDLQDVKKRLYRRLTAELKFFPRDPGSVRMLYQAVGIVLGVAGGGLVFLLGSFAGAGIVGVPVIVLGLLALLLAPLMPRRTAAGRLMYRRCLGFRRYIETAERDRQAFAEKRNLFDEYLPYAIVFECVDKWAKAFEGLGDTPQSVGWYEGSAPFSAGRFARDVSGFSKSIAAVMAATPGGRGGSGFGGGGFSGGGGGGGGGGSW